MICDMLVPLKSNEEIVSRLTSAATIVEMLDHATSEIASACSSGRQSALNLILRSELHGLLKNRMSRLTSAVTMKRMDEAKKLPGEGFKRPWPPLIKMDEAVKAKVEKLFGGTR